MFPIKYDRYIEVFGGSGAVLLGKKNKDKFEVYNDFNYNLVNLFRCIKSRPNALIMELGFCNLNARDDFYAMNKFFKDGEYDDRFMNEELELTKKIFKDIDTSEYTELFTRRMLDYDVRRAAMFLKVLRYSYSSGGKSFGGQPYDIRKLFKLIQDVSIRLNETVIENQSYEVLIPHYDRDNSFFYCDPPYYTSEYVYSCGFTEEMHLLLRDVLMNIKGRFLLSYNDCQEVREWYKGCYFYDFKRVHSMAQRYEAGKEFPELLIANYDLREKTKSNYHQMDFDECNSKLIININEFIERGLSAA